MKTIKPFLGSTHFIVGNLVANVRLGNTYATTQSKFSIFNSNVVNAPQKKIIRTLLAQEKC
jgi:hypothetical protein